MWLRYATLLGVGLVLAGLTGCGGNSSPDPTPTPLPPTQTPVPPAELGQIVWATAIDEATKAPRDQVTDYPNDTPTIYAVVPVARIKGETQVTAEWDYDGVAMPQLTTTVSAPDLPNGGWIEFHISRASNLFWPVGTYRVRISVNGQVLQEGSVTVYSR